MDFSFETQRPVRAADLIALGELVAYKVNGFPGDTLPLIG